MFPTSVLLISSLSPLFFSLLFKLSSTTSPTVTNVIHPSPLSVLQALLFKLFKHDGKSNCKRKLRQRMLYVAL